MKGEVLTGINAVRDVSNEDSVLTIMQQLGCFDRETKGSGTGTVLAGLSIFLAVGERFRDAVLLAVNALGSDTDTIGAFVGGMCGAAHGYESVPHEWASQVQDYDYFMRVATEVTRISCRRGIGGQALRPKDVDRPRQLPDLVERLRGHDISQGERIHHPLFGAGWVKSIDAQKLRRKDGATVVLAWVEFDIGQSCKFRYMEIPQQRNPSRGGSSSGPSQPGLFAEGDAGAEQKGRSGSAEL